MFLCWISRFGLLEMSRQRLKPSLRETMQIDCPHCAGNDAIRMAESPTLSVVHIVEEEGLNENTGHVKAALFS